MLEMPSRLKELRAVVLAGGIWSFGISGAYADACARGQASFHARQYEEAQESLWQCMLSDGGDTQAAHLLTLTYRETKDYKAGLRRANTALAHSGKSVDLLYIAAFLHF